MANSYAYKYSIPITWEFRMNSSRWRRSGCAEEAAVVAAAEEEVYDGEGMEGKMMRTVKKRNSLL